MNSDFVEPAPCRPRVSVIIPCFNHGEFLGEAIDSVRAQRYSPGIEIMVVNDGSTDRTTLQSLEDLKSDVTLINQTNRGLVAARNRGIEESSGEYVLPLDADDRIADDFVHRAVAELDGDPEVGIVYGYTELMGEKTGLWQQPDFAMPDMLFENMIVATALFRKDDWRSVGGYSPSMRYAWEDWDFWLSLIAMGRKVVRLQTTTFYYRMHSASMTSRLSFSKKLLLMIRLVVRHRKMYLAFRKAAFSRLLSPSYRKIPDPRG